MPRTREDPLQKGCLRPFFEIVAAERDRSRQGSGTEPLGSQEGVRLRPERPLDGEPTIDEEALPRTHRPENPPRDQMSAASSCSARSPARVPPPTGSALSEPIVPSVDKLFTQPTVASLGERGETALGQALQRLSLAIVSDRELR